nr:uroporphyrinogen decarboxylase family protein [Candidatus Sigynarchaeota archaeon]
MSCFLSKARFSRHAMILPTDTMGATERFETIIHGGVPDRIPIHMMGIPEYSTTHIQFLAKEEDLVEHDPFFQDERNMLFTPLGDKTREFYFGAEDTVYSTGYDKEFEKLLDNDGKIITDPDIEARYRKKPEGQFVNYKGRRNGWKMLETGHKYTWYIDGFLKRKEDIISWFDEHGWPHQLPMRKIDVMAVNEFRSRFGDRMFLNGGINRSGLFEETWFMMGMDAFARHCMTDPDLIHRVVNAALQADLNAVDLLKPLHFSCIYMSDDLGQKGRPLLSPRMFRKFFFEPYKALFGAMHDIGARIFLHSCGNVFELLPLLIEAGLDGWQSMEVPAEIDHAAVKKQ